MNKQQLSGALAYVDSRSSSANSQEVDDIIAAARLVERLLPDTCEDCNGSGTVFNRGAPFSGSLIQQRCDGCCGSGRVWDLETVERIGTVTTDPRWAHIESPLLLEFALAVLAALNSPTPEEEQ